MSDKVSLREHFEALRAADAKALDLAREIQHYKDEKANDLREQIASERGVYLTAAVYNERHEELIRRINFLENEQAKGGGHSEGLNAGWSYLLGLVALVSTVTATAVLVLPH